MAKDAEAFRASGADFIVAFGGGSPMDVAKAMAVVAKYGGSITEYEGGGKVPGDIIPLIAIPTIAGTGKYRKIYNYISPTPAADDFEPIELVSLLRELNAELGIPASLKETGVTPDKFDAMADDAMKSGNIAVNPRANRIVRPILDTMQTMPSWVYLVPAVLLKMRKQRTASSREDAVRCFY